MPQSYPPVLSHSVACGCHTAGPSRVAGQGMCVKRLCCPKSCLGLGLLLSSLPCQLVKEILTQHPWIHRAPGGVGEFMGKGTPQAAPGCAEQLCWSCGAAGGSSACVIPAWGIDFSSPGWLSLGVPLPALPCVSLQVRVSLCGTCPPSHTGTHRDTEPWGCSTGTGTERFGKRFAKGSLKGSVQGRGQCSSCCTL